MTKREVKKIAGRILRGFMINFLTIDLVREEIQDCLKIEPVDEDIEAVMDEIYRRIRRR